eukprot:PhF_6_TR30132/c0_g1_i1/m.44063
MTSVPLPLRPLSWAYNTTTNVTNMLMYCWSSDQSTRPYNPNNPSGTNPPGPPNTGDESEEETIQDDEASTATGPPPHSFEYYQMLALAKVNALEKQYEGAVARVKDIETELMDAKINCVNIIPIEDTDISKESERLALEVFNTRNMRHVHPPAVSVFELEEMLKKVSVIRDEFPSMSELQSVYLTLEQELSHVNGRKLEKKQELVGELDKFLELNREVLMLETLDSLLARTNTSTADVNEEQQSLPEFFEQAKKKEHKLIVRMKALMTAVHDTDMLEDTTNALSLQSGNALESYFSEIAEKLRSDQEALRIKRSDFKAAHAATMTTISSIKSELKTEQHELLERIKSNRAQLERDIARWMQVNVLITEKEKEEDKHRKVEQRVEERLGETQALLEARLADANAGGSIARVQQVIEKNIKSTCGKKLDDRRQTLSQHLLQSHAEFFTVCRTHWQRTVASHDEAVESVKDLSRLLQSESTALRTQRKHGADPAIIKLQEALCEQRLKLVNEKKGEVYRLKKELESISKQLDHMNTITVLRGNSKYQSLVVEDFRDAFHKAQRQMEPLERLEEIHDLLVLCCDPKNGVLSSTAPKDTESIDALINCLDTLEYKGAFPEVRSVLEQRSDMKNSLSLLCGIVDQHTRHPNSAYMDRVFVNGKPLRRCLNIVRSKLGQILEDPGTGSAGSVATNPHDSAALVTEDS